MTPGGTASDLARPDVPVRPPRRGSRLLLAAAAAVVAVTLAAWWVLATAPAPLSRADVDQAVQRGIERAQQAQRNAPPDATVAYRTISPSLVTVTVQRPTGTATTENGLGTGVVIDAAGAVLTALHVVDGATGIRVAFADGTGTTARVAASAPDRDIAVLAPDRLPAVVVPAVMAGGPQVGDTVFAVGNPLGLQASLTAGVVSALDRSITTDSGRTLASLIQFDAAVNPGNSGGPLLNRAGQVVGIVTGLANPARQDFFVGIGFAVPIAEAAGVAGGPQQ